MRTLICLLPLLALALSAPTQLSDRQKLMRKIWGADVDLMRAKRILEEEGNKLGLSGQEYFDGCTADAERMQLTEEEKADMEKDMEAAKKMGNKIKFETKDEVLPTFEKHFPNTYAMFMKRLDLIKQYIGKLDEESQKFANHVGDLVLESMVTVSKSASDPLENPMQQLTQMAKQFNKLITEYKALPQSSKDALERTFCSRASIRIVDTEGRFVMFISMMSALAEMGEM